MSLVKWAQEHLRQNEIAAIDEKIADLEDQIVRLRLRRRLLTGAEQQIGTE